MRAMKDAAEEQARLEEFPETPARRPQRPQPQRSVRPQPAPAPEPSQRGLLAQHHLTSGVGSQHLDSTVAGQHLGSQVARQHLVSSLAGRPETRRTERETGTPNLLADLERRLNPSSGPWSTATSSARPAAWSRAAGGSATNRG